MAGFFLLISVLEIDPAGTGRSPRQYKKSQRGPFDRLSRRKKRPVRTAWLETSSYGKKIDETAGRFSRRPAGEIRDLRWGL